MKKLNKVSQKTTSAIVALMLAGIITFSAGMDSFGVINELKKEANFEANLASMEILERAYEDTFAEEDVLDFESQEVRTIKIFDNNDELLEVIELGGAGPLESAARPPE